jgi:hypothetical protein
VSKGLWRSHANVIEVENFRADRQYLGCQAEYPYVAMGAWATEREPTLIAGMVEDAAFGCNAFGYKHAPDLGYVVSRDLLDSVAELHFLRSNLVGVRRVLDIGSGYGRLAHRWTEVDPDVFVFCTDPVPVSRVVCEKYLAFRGVTRAMVVRPEELGRLMSPDLAVNIHSWSECTLDEVVWWLDWLVERNVEHLFTIPHDVEYLTGWGADGRWEASGPSFRPELESRGWRVTHEWYGPECWPRTMTLWGRA